MPTEQAQLSIVEAGPALFSMFDEKLQEYAQKTLEGWGVEVLLGEVVESVSPTRVKLKSGRELQGAHPGLGRGPAGPPAGGHDRGRARAGQPDPGRPRPQPRRPPGGVRGRRRRLDHRLEDRRRPPATRLGRAAGGRARRREHRRAARRRQPEPFAYHDKGTMATIGRGAAVIQFAGGRTMKGRTAFLGLGRRSPALLSTGEDRTKAMLDWTWAGFTHERGGRIVVDDDDDD